MMSIKFLSDIFRKSCQKPWLVLLLILTNTCLAQVNEFKFRQITTDNGLIDDMVISLQQDARGYMWFGTRSGLVRYDGINLITYSYNPNQPDGLSGNNIDALYPDRQGNLWIGTINGLCRYDVDLDRIVGIKIEINQQTWTPQINDITSDKNGLFWIATQKDGLFSYNPSTNKFVHFIHDPSKPNSLEGSNVQTVLCTKDNVLWIGTEKGLFKLDRKSGTFTHIGSGKKSSIALSDSIVISLAEGENGDIWIGTVSGGLNRLNLKNKTLKIYKHIPNDPNSLSENLITSILYDNGKVWLGCGRGNYALQCLDVRSGNITKYDIGEKQLGPRILGAVNDIFKDKTGIIWICQSYGGVSYFDPNWENYQHYELNPKNPRDLINAVYGTMPISNNQLWLSSFDGFILFDRNKGIIKKYNDNGQPLFLRNKSIKVGNQLWAPTDNGIFRLDLQTGKINHMQKAVNSSNVRADAYNGLSGSYVNTLVLDKDGYVWAGSRLGGLDRIDPKTDYVKHFIHIDGDPSSLPENSVFPIYEIDEQHFWIGTNGGLALFNEKNETFKNYPYDPSDSTSISSNQISDICRSHSGILWIATYGGGLNRFYPKTGSFKRYTSQNKNIPNNTVYSCVDDENDNIWISTAAGIARFSPENEQCDFVLQQPDYYKVSKLPDGELCYSGPRGMIIINPENIKINSFAPQISLESVKINGHSRPISLFTNSLELEHNQNDIEFNFYAAHFSNPSQNKYAVFLKGYDDDWRNLGTAGFINYTNLEPGHYTLNVKAASTYDIWSKPLQLEIIINPPLWETWWAYVLYGVIFLLLLWRVDKFQKARAIRKEKERAQKKELEQAKEIEKAYTELKSTQAQLIHSEKMASLGELTAGIAHEIKNPLNFVNNFSEVSNDLITEMLEEADKGNTEEVKEIAKGLKQNLEKINHHGKRADSIVKGMLLHSRGTAGEKTPTDINDLLEQYVTLAYHGMRAQNKDFNIKIERDYDNTLEKINVVPQDISRVFLNIINNGCYAANERKKQNEGGFSPTIKVSTKNLKDKVEIRIADNGNGVPDKIKDKLFQPFYTTKPTGEGTGLGLSLSYDIVVKQHGGEIKIESKEGEGAEFIITLPYM